MVDLDGSLHFNFYGVNFLEGQGVNRNFLIVFGSVTLFGAIVAGRINVAVFGPPPLWWDLWLWVGAAIATAAFTWKDKA